MTSNKTITLEGPFTDDDVKAFANLLRACEQRTPEIEFSMLVHDHDPNVPTTTLKEKLLDMFPGLRGVPVEIREMSKEKKPDGNAN